MNIMWSPVWATIHGYLRDFFLHVAIVSVDRTATRTIWVNLIYLHADEAVTFRRFPSYGRSETLCALFVTTSTANRCWFHHYTYRYYFLISTKITFTLHFCNVWNCSPNHNVMANVPHFSSLVPNMNLGARTNNELFDKRQQNNIIHTKRPKIRRAAFFFFYSSAHLPERFHCWFGIGDALNWNFNKQLIKRVAAIPESDALSNRSISIAVFSFMFSFTFTNMPFLCCCHCCRCFIVCHVHSSVGWDEKDNKRKIESVG